MICQKKEKTVEWFVIEVYSVSRELLKILPVNREWADIENVNRNFVTQVGLKSVRCLFA